ncbi:hypothetical protein [Nannocystis exedens]|uniref:hypothetical protein n=1 Tax=Nannocystis exedens TaxID=54 RepID=UPI000BBA0CE7|nr:hypothetical protein [Nannocystis exedens]
MKKRKATRRLISENFHHGLLALHRHLRRRRGLAGGLGLPLHPCEQVAIHAVVLRERQTIRALKELTFREELLAYCTRASDGPRRRSLGEVTFDVGAARTLVAMLSTTSSNASTGSWAP